MYNGQRQLTQWKWKASEFPRAELNNTYFSLHSIVHLPPSASFRADFLGANDTCGFWCRT